MQSNASLPVLQAQRIAKAVATASRAANDARDAETRAAAALAIAEEALASRFAALQSEQTVLQLCLQKKNFFIFYLFIYLLLGAAGCRILRQLSTEMAHMYRERRGHTSRPGIFMCMCVFVTWECRVNLQVNDQDPRPMRSFW
jgi:hypothetical protein